MTVLRSSAVLSTAALLLTLSVALGPLGCGGSTSHGDAGVGGSAGGDASASGGSSGASGGSNGATGGRGGGSGATGGMSGGDAGVDARTDANGAGGRIVLVDASGNNFTCQDLLACCASITDATAKAQCMLGYTTVSPGGNASCNNLLTQIKANGGCP